MVTGTECEGAVVAGTPQHNFRRLLRIPRHTIFQILDSIKQSEHIQVIHIDPEIDQIGWQLCQARPDKAWSLVDCTSFVIMQQMNMTAALTTDQHCEQAGFLRLLKSNGRELM